MSNDAKLGPSIFSQTNHEVYAITANTEDGGPCGFTATWVLPASLLPGTPRSLVLASPLNYTTGFIRSGKRLVLHMLASGQAELMAQLGLASGRDHDKFAGIAWQSSAYGPLLAGVLGYEQCRLVHEVDLGERLLLVLERDSGEVFAGKEPLTKQAAFAALPSDKVAALRERHKVLGAESQSLWKDFS